MSENQPTHQRFPLLAALMTLIAPGMGQIYNGQARKAGILCAWVVVFAFAVRSPLVIWGGIAAVALSYLVAIFGVIYLVSDAWRHAKRDRPRASYNQWYVYLGYFFAASIGYVFISFVSNQVSAVEYFSIPANSMAPALAGGDFVIVDRRTSYVQPPKVGQIAIFRYPRDEQINYVKRIMGVAGDVVEFRKKKLYLNGNLVKLEAVPELGAVAALLGEEDREVLTLHRETLGEQSYEILLNEKSLLNDSFGPTTVPAGHFFTLGDNRDRSSDSRIWGMVPEKNLIGRPRFIYYSRDPESKEIRWNRMGGAL